jgi:aldose 1-epimerase
VALDNCFDGWDGRATIAWPARRLRLDLAAPGPFRHLVIYTPPGQPFFCVEPVSHANGQVGLAALAARGTLAGEVQFRLSAL